MALMAGLSIHHIGVAVEDIEVAAMLYVKRYGYTVCSPVIHDPTQTAHVQFFRLAGDSVFLELVMPDSPSSKLAAFVRKGGGLNHICYKTADLRETVDELRALEMVILCEPTPAAAFPGRMIAWLMGMDMSPVELVERGPREDSL